MTNYLTADADKVVKEIRKLRRTLAQNKGKLSGQQYMDMMVLMRGMEARQKILLRDANKLDQTIGSGKDKPVGNPFKVGDKVRIKRDPEMEGHNWYKRYAGKEGKITNIFDKDEVELSTDRRVYFWHVDWLEKIS